MLKPSHLLATGVLLVSLACFNLADPIPGAGSNDGPEVIDTGPSGGASNANGGSSESGASSGNKGNVTDEKPEEYWIWERRWIQEYDRRCMQQRPCPRPAPCAPCACATCPSGETTTKSQGGGSAQDAYRSYMREADKCAQQYFQYRQNEYNIDYRWLRDCVERAIRSTNNNPNRTTRPPYGKSTSYYNAYRRGH